MYTFNEERVFARGQSSCRYLLRKVKKFYPLHIAVFIGAVPLWTDALATYDLKKRLLITLAYNSYTNLFPNNIEKSTDLRYNIARLLYGINNIIYITLYVLGCGKWRKSCEI